MRKLLLAAALLLAPSAASAQCNGLFPPHTFCGNATGATGIAGQVPQSTSAVPGGSNGQVQFNNGGNFGGSTSITVNPLPTITSATLISPILTGSPIAPTPSTSDNSTLIPTTAFVKAQTWAASVINYLASGASAVSITLQVILGWAVLPEMYGAKCDGTTDDSLAIQRAINSNGSSNVRVLFSPSCTYKVINATSITITGNRVTLEGAPLMGSTIDFEPTGNATLFAIGNGASETFENSIRGFNLYSTDTSHVKKMITLSDSSKVLIENLHCSGDPVNDVPNLIGSGSICLQTNGRDLSTFRNLNFAADKPIVLGVNPNFANLDVDHYHFQDLYLSSNATNPNPCITVLTGVVVTSMSLDGREAWAGCSGGFSLIDTTSAQAGYDLNIQNARCEQDRSGGTAPCIDIETNNNIRGVTIINAQLDPNAPGIKLRKVLGATIIGTNASCAATAAIDINTTDDLITFGGGNNWQSGCVVTNSSGTPMTQVEAFANPTGSAVPNIGTYAAAGAPWTFRTFGSQVLTLASTLPACGATYKGQSAFVSDATSTGFAYHATAAGGGTTNVRVTCDGSNWYYD